MTFTKACSQLKEQIEKCDAILVGAGAGMSASSGFDYSGEPVSYTHLRSIGRI